MSEELLNPLIQPQFDLSTLRTATKSISVDEDSPESNQYETNRTIVGLQSVYMEGDATGQNGGDFSARARFNGTKLIVDKVNVGYGGGWGSINITYLYLPE